MASCGFNEVEQLKKRILDNVSVNDQLVCGFCDELIAAARKKKDAQSIAFGYVWRADYYFYVASDLIVFAKELEFARTYIDERTPSELLEKYYTLKHVLYENSYDIQSAFRFTLKALDVAEKLQLHHRVGANYGNIGAFYMEICCFEEALLYTEKALKTLWAQPETKPRILRLLLTNLVQICLQTGEFVMAKQALKELTELPIAEKDLKIYIDYGYLLYYSAQLDQKNSLLRLHAMFEDGLLDFPRAFAFEFTSKALEAMLHLKQQDSAKKLLDLLQGMVQEDEADAQLSLCKLNLEYARRFGSPERLRRCYREYYTRYMAAQAKANERKAEGLHAKVTLQSLYITNNTALKELGELSELANYDELTNVYNRRYLNIQQDEIINSAQIPNLGFAIIDIDFFKEYNDHYGHPAGDALLRIVATCLKNCATKQMMVFRYGGDEFVCLYRGAQQQELKAYVQNVQIALNDQKIEHIHSHCSDRVTLSIGYGNRLVTGKFDMLALFEEVDDALYAVKNSGRNNIRSIFEIHEQKEENVDARFRYTTGADSTAD